jgi:GNAT superfamily N-acetyltransferase
MVEVRLAAPPDVPGMMALWLEKVTLQQQTDRRFRLAPDGGARWSQTVQAWLNNPQCALYVAVADEAQVVGYVIAQIQPGPPGLLPDRVGVVLELAVGAHSYQSGLGRRLVEPVRAWLIEQGVQVMMAQVPHRQPVEQAFWRAMKGTILTDTMWIKL